MSTGDGQGRAWRRGSGLATGIAIGLGVGGLLAVAVDQVGFVGTGLVLGVAIGAALEARSASDDPSAEPSPDGEP